MSINLSGILQKESLYDTALRFLSYGTVGGALLDGVIPSPSDGTLENTIIDALIQTIGVQIFKYGSNKKRILASSCIFFGNITGKALYIL
ncbi:MAG: hypothetical protein AABW56_04885 [Nanoarchaeota archaeon]